MENKSKSLPIIFLPAITTGVLITLFLSGKIIDIPLGTAKGGIIGGVAVLVIMISMINLSGKSQPAWNRNLKPLFQCLIRKVFSKQPGWKMIRK